MGGGALEVLASGGPVLALLLAISVVSIALIVAKALELRGVLSGADRCAEALSAWQRGDRHSALKTVEEGPTPVDRILSAAMSGLIAGRPRAALEKDLEWRGNAEIAELSRRIRLLELVAMISPLLGLLGTVLGMIQAFRELSLAGGAANASILASGIWQALLTTAAGLVVAIPAAVAAALLAARVERAGQAMESAVGALVTLEDQRR